MKIKKINNVSVNITLAQKNQYEDLLDNEKHQCGYQNNSARTSLAYQRHIKSTNMETSLSANLKFTIEKKNCSSKFQGQKRMYILVNYVI
jgi:hypothetical protein